MNQTETTQPEETEDDASYAEALAVMTSTSTMTASSLGSDSSQSQSDMRLAAGVIRALLNRSIDASGAAGQLSIRLTSSVTVEG